MSEPTEIEVRRTAEGRVRRPRTKEPYCVHPFTYTPVVTYQPASACRYCSQGEELARWKAEWAAWLAENPDSWEAREVARMEQSTRSAQDGGSDA